MTQERPGPVLVVDDDPDILDAVCEVLRQEGYRVERARHGQEALEKVLEKVEEERPRVILLDLMMPIMDGREFALALRARGVEIPIVVISADGNRRNVAEVRPFGYLPKPFDIEALLTCVAQATAAPPAGPAGGVIPS